MRIPTDWPAAWGRTKRLVLEQPEDDEWLCSDWYELVDPPAGGKLDHGTDGCIAPDTVLVTLGDELIALADALNIGAVNLYAWDKEYYLVLRVRNVVDGQLWAKLPWARFGAGNVVHVWDKFHGIAWFRGQHDDAQSMSYGGDWAHLEELVNREYPPPVLPTVTDARGPDQLLSAVRANDLARVRELIARGVPVVDSGVPDGVRCLELGVSHARPTSALWESIQEASPELMEALLVAGAPVDARPPGGLTALHYAVIARRPNHVRMLLRHGADVTALYDGKTAIELADAIGGELAIAVRGR